MSCLAGVNLPTLSGAYNHDLAPNPRYPDWEVPFTPMLAYRYLTVCRDLGMRAVRIWLCENGEGITLRDGAPQVMPELLEAIRVFQDGAQLCDMKLYWTLLDANAWRRNGDALTAEVVARPETTAAFAANVARPIAEILDPRTTFALEVFNEPECLSRTVHPTVGLAWSDISRAIDHIRSAIHEVNDGLWVTSGTQAAFLPELCANGIPVDAIDLHIYHPSGGLPPRGDLPIDIGNLPLFCGEAGVSAQGPLGQTDYLLNYLHNGLKMDYRAVFLWQLEGELCARAPNERDAAPHFSWTPLGGAVRELLWDDWPR